LYYVDLERPLQPSIEAPVLPLVDTDDAAYSPFGNVGSKLYVMTDLDAPRRRIVTLDLGKREPAAWNTVIPEASNVIESYTLTGGAIALQYLVDVQSELLLFSLEGRALGRVALPAIGTVAGLSGRNDGSELFYAFTSPLYPATVFAYHRQDGTSSPFE